jgi:hypothetical protein
VLKQSKQLFSTGKSQNFAQLAILLGVDTMDKGTRDEGDPSLEKAKDAVFVGSEPMPDGAIPVRGIDFDLHGGGELSVADLVEGMAGMGFQASAVGDAVHTINEMVRRRSVSSTCMTPLSGSDIRRRDRGEMMEAATAPPYSSAILRT